MAITNNDIKIYQSQDNTDNDSGGGARTSVEIADGDVNNLFPDISRIDTVSGDVAMRKVFPTVKTNNDDKYYGSHAIIRKKPNDANVSALLFHSDNPFDKRLEAQGKIESYLVASYAEQFYLYGNHVTGSKTVTFLAKERVTLPTVGEVYLIELIGFGSQYIRISDISISELILTISSGGSNTDYTRKRIICKIEQPLEYDFQGRTFDPTTEHISDSSTMNVFSTQIANAAKFYGIKKLEADALVNDLTLKVDNIFEQIVPSTTSQTSLVNVTALPLNTSFKDSGEVITVSAPITSILGSIVDFSIPIVPNTLDIHGGFIVDDGLGNLFVTGTATPIGFVDYAAGVITFTLGAQVSGTVVYSFRTGFGAFSDYQYTGTTKITQGNQSTQYVENFSPLPSSSNLRIDYRSSGKWYTILGNFDGTLGNDPDIGVGTVNDNLDGTGTLSLTLGALPDLDSSIIYSWASLDRLTNRSSESSKMILGIDFIDNNLNPLTFSFVYSGGTITADAAGVLIDTTGVITGYLDYYNGKMFIEGHDNASRFDAFTDTANWSYDYSNEATGTNALRNDIIATANTSIAGDIIFTTFDQVNDTYIFDLQENVTFESLKFDVRVAFDLTVYSPQRVNQGRYKTVSLVCKSDGVLVEYDDRNNTVTWGSVTAAGVVTILPPLITYKTKSTKTSRFLFWVSTTTYYKTVTARPSLTDKRYALQYRSSGTTTFPNAVTGSGTLDSIGKIRVNLPVNITGEIALRLFVNNNYASNAFISKGDNLFEVGGTNGNIQRGTINRSEGYIDLPIYRGVDSFYSKFLVLATDEEPVQELVTWSFTFRTSATKLISSSFQLRYENEAGVSRSLTSDNNGVISGTNIDPVESYVDTATGMVNLVFTEGVVIESFKYDAVAVTVLPVDPELLGLNPVRLPVDGRVPIFVDGSTVIIFNEVTTATVNATPLANDVDTLARQGQSYIEVIDVNGKRLDPVQYVADKVAGTVTFNGTLALVDKYTNPLTAPFSIVDRVEDMTTVNNVQINGQMNLNAALTHAHPALNSYIASALVFGDTGARYYSLFSQEIWDNGNPVWQDTVDGVTTTPQYDTINYPLVIDNANSTSGRWAIIFTGTSTVKVAHEKLGVVLSSVGITVDDVAPINPATGLPYFTMKLGGFGSGWVANNVIRFNTDSGDNNMWVIRTVKSGALTQQADNIEIEIRGDAN